MVRFADKRVVVTGGASGIGAACVTAFASEGAHVTVADLDEASGAAVVQGVTAGGGKASFMRTDVATEDGWRALVEAVGPIDVVVLNAFVHIAGAAHELRPDDWHRQMDVNLTQVYLAAHLLGPRLAARGGSLVAVSSVHALVGLPGHPAYAAAKAGMCGLVRQLATEYGPGMRANAVLPGPIGTEQWHGRPPEALAQAASETVLRRVGTADEVAKAIAFLASPDASYITGASLVVDGGWSTFKNSP